VARESDAIVRHFAVVARGPRDVNLIKCRFLAAAVSAVNAAFSAGGGNCDQYDGLPGVDSTEPVRIYRCHATPPDVEQIEYINPFRRERAGTGTQTRRAEKRAFLRGTKF